MKKLYILCLFAFSFIANAQIINFPDANFKAKLLSATAGNSSASNGVASTDSQYPGGPSFYHKIDVNNDGEIQVSEAAAIRHLNVTNANISDLTGISFFTNLKTLWCSSNQLNSLGEALQLTSLFDLQCNSNNLAQIDVTNLLNLKGLQCGNNDLTNLDTSQTTYLEYLQCVYNQITNLDVSINIYLEQLLCNNNQLTSLDVSGSLLRNLRCHNNFLTSLDVSQCFLLTTLFCTNNNLEVLNIKNGNANWTNFGITYNPNLLYVCADEEDISLVQGQLVGNSNCHVNTYCTFTPGGNYYKITGETKFDSDNNGCDINDFDYKKLFFNISDGVNLSSLISNQTGNFYIPVGTGVFSISPTLENPTYFTISPTSFTVNFPTQASPFTQDFCVTANGVKSDVEVLVMSTVPARPGFDANYKIVYRNKGNQVENGSVSLTFDDATLDYLSSNPVFNSQATNSLTWNYTNLQPFETREIEVVFNVNSPMETPAVNNDDILNYTATIATSNTDETPNDNSFTLNQTVVGSYDPNDKTCLEGKTVSPDMIGKYVHYVIRFENTGTYPAENVVVKDIIDLAKFDIATLIPLKGSHDYYTRIKDNKVEFIFENINLDFNDATNDGYVAFKIKTKSNLLVGNTFSNNANIYFDYNFPITTNTYTTTIAALSTQNFEFGAEFTLYPNPVKEVLNIQSKNGFEINSIEIYNLLGQVVLAVPNVTNAIDVSNLTKGNYFIKVNTNNGTSNTKFLKE